MGNIYSTKENCYKFIKYESSYPEGVPRQFIILKARYRLISGAQIEFKNYSVYDRERVTGDGHWAV